MKDLENHKKQFEEIVKKYNLFQEQKAKKIATFLTTKKESKISLKDFSDRFNIEEKDAVIFLSFIQKGIQFKEKHID